MKKMLFYLVALFVLTTVGLTSCSKDDPQVLAQSISLSQQALAIRTGQEAHLTAFTNPDGSGNVSWSSSNEAVVSVDASGLVKAISKGDATITAVTTDGTNLSATCNVLVLPYLTKMIILDKKEVSLELGSSISLTASYIPENVDTKTLDWASADASVATVKDGVITAKHVGKTVVTATTTDGTKISASCIVNVTSAGKTVEVAVNDLSQLNETLLTALGQTTGTILVNIGKAGETIKAGDIILDKEITTSGQTIKLNFMALPVSEDKKPISIKDNQTSATGASMSNIYIDMPAAKAGQTEPSFIINLPSSTVTLQGVKYNTIETTTADKTLYIEAGVTVQELVIVKGNVYVSGVVEKVSAKAKTIVYVLKDAKVNKVVNDNNYITLVDLGGTDAAAGIGENSNVNNNYQWKE